MLRFRRLYLYLASTLSLILLLTGGISLAQLLFSGALPQLPSDQLASALAYTLVGFVSLVGHWSVIQRQIAQFPDEAATPVRLVFLYSALLTTLFAVVLNVLTLLNQFILILLGVPSRSALFSESHTLTEGLVTILLCSLAAAYFFSVLRKDFSRVSPHAAWRRVRVGYRYNWLLFSLGLLLIGLQQTVLFILQIPLLSGAAERAALGNGLAFILVAAPLWVMFEHLIQKSAPDPDLEAERVRLTFNTGIYLILTASLLFFLGFILSISLRLLFQNTFSAWLGDVTLPLSITIPLAVLWLPYQRKLTQELRAPRLGAPKMGAHILDPDRTYIQRALRYSFAWLGLASGFAGLQFLAVNLIDLAIQGKLLSPVAWGAQATLQITRALPALAIGFPLWLAAWRKASFQARLDSETGEISDQARPRLLYLNTVVLLGLAGVIFSAGWFINQLARAVLDGSLPSMLLKSLPPAVALLLFAILLAYHAKLQQTDQRLHLRQRSRRYALFPVLVLTPEAPPMDNPPQTGFGDLIARALEHEMPGLPIALHCYTSGAPDETLSAAKAVILPAQLLTRPPESILLWLQGYSGVKLVIPETLSDWYWPGAQYSLAHLARITARKVRGLAESAGNRRFA